MEQVERSRKVKHLTRNKRIVQGRGFRFHLASHHSILSACEHI